MTPFATEFVKAHRQHLLLEAVVDVSRRRMQRMATERQSRADEAISVVSGQTGVSREKILGRRRTEDVAKARHQVWKMLHEDGWSFSRIARRFNRDHTTIMHGVKKAEEGAEIQSIKPERLETKTVEVILPRGSSTTEPVQKHITMPKTPWEGE